MIRLVCARLLTVCSAPLLLALAVTACNVPPEGPFESGIAPERTIASLSSEEVDAYCEAAVAHLVLHTSEEETHRFRCEARVLEVTSDLEMCESVIHYCSLEQRDIVPYECPIQGPRDLCMATVGQYEQCIDDLARDLVENGSRIDCALMGTLEPYPDSCRAFFEACPHRWRGNPI